MRAALRISPKIAMFDAPVKIIADGLKKNQKVAIRSMVSHLNEIYEAEAHYQADEKGIVDCTKHPALDGSYKGVHPMGLFWALRPAQGQRPGLRLMPRSVTEPLTYQFSLKSDTETLSEVTCKRLLLHPNVTRHEVSEGRLRGALFLPKGIPSGQKLPGIIDLYGTAGGLVEYRASLMAGHGFAVLALAHFNYKDLPTSFTDMELEYFELSFREAANWLSSHPSVLPQGLGIVGISFGADLAILLATVCPKIKAVAAINGLHMLDDFNPINYKGKQLETVRGDAENMSFVDGKLHYVKCREHFKDHPDLIYKVEQSNAKFLFLASEDDLSTPACYSANVLARRLKDADRSSNCEVMVFPKTGHLLEPPYIPFCDYSFHKVVGGFMAWGGEPVTHSVSQEKFWTVLKQFWTNHVGQPITLPPVNEENEAKSKL